MSETLQTAFDALERKIIALGEEKNQLKNALRESEARYETLQLDFGSYKQNIELENGRLTADNALLSDKLSKLISRVESMKQNL
ncbi:hypothetical protein [Ignatzschineria sp. LJL83]